MHCLHKKEKIKKEIGLEWPYSDSSQWVRVRICPPGDVCQCLKIVSVVTTVEAGYKRHLVVEARDADKHPARHKTDPSQQLLVPKYQYLDWEVLFYRLCFSLLQYTIRRTKKDSSHAWKLFYVQIEQLLISFLVSLFSCRICPVFIRLAHSKPSSP